jgi:hypothetical protein
MTEDDSERILCQRAQTLRSHVVEGELYLFSLASGKSARTSFLIFHPACNILGRFCGGGGAGTNHERRGLRQFRKI